MRPPVYYVNPLVPSCDHELKEGISKKEIPRVRRIVREGIVSTLRDTWPANRRKIWKTIRRGNYAKVVKLLSSYIVDIIGIRAYNFNPNLELVCNTPDYPIKYNLGIKEMVSHEALQNRIVKGFWRDVGKIFKALLRKARRMDIKDLKTFMGLSEDREYYDSSLMQPTKKIHPKIVNRIENWK